MSNRLTDQLQAPWRWVPDQHQPGAGEIRVGVNGNARLGIDLSEDSSKALVNAVNIATGDERGETPYVIWSNEHRGWWGPARRGYVPDLESAGCYTREAAMLICYEAGPSSLRMGRGPGGGIVPAEIAMRLEDARMSALWHRANAQVQQ
jgi:hypothetical protein